MRSIENALLLDICLGFPFGKQWFSAEMPEVNPKDVPNTFLLKGKQLAAVKVLAMRSDSSVARAIEGLCAQADTFLAMPNPSVVEKPSVLEGASINDYCSLAKYAWPNLDSLDGKPYITRDGEVNPECYSTIYDVKRLDNFADATVILAIAAFLSGNQLYAEKANSLINTWLINPVTRQTPHFRFAQVIPGKDTVRFQGLVEARRLIYVCEAIQLLKYLNAISEDDFEQCIKWFGELLEWFETSIHGKKAQNAKNNIGFWVDLQRIIYARFCEKSELADKVVCDSVIPRINDQIDDEGKLPRELTRAKPYDYVAFTLLAFAELSVASRRGEIQLADYSTDEGRSFQNAFNWFNETINVNGLNESAFALSQLAISQRELTQLKAEKRLLEMELKPLKEALETISQQSYESVHNKSIVQEPLSEQYSDDVCNSSVKIEAAFQRVSARLQVIEKECSGLRSELSQKNRLLSIAAVRYRGVNFIIKEQSQLLKKTKQKLDDKTLEHQQYLEQLAYKEKELDTVKSQLGMERQRNKELTEQLQQAIHEQQFRVQLEKTKEQLSQLQEDLKAKRELNNQLNAQLKKQEADISKIRIRNEKISQERSRMELRYNAIQNSRTWRYTLPVRKTLDLIKEVLHR